MYIFSALTPKMRESQTNKSLMLQQIFFFILFFYTIHSNYYIQNDIFYQAPYLNIEFTNITFGLSVSLSKKKSSFSYQSYAGGVMAAVCQADQLNHKLYTSIHFTGIINLAIQDYSFDDEIGQYSTLELQKTTYITVKIAILYQTIILIILLDT